MDVGAVLAGLGLARQRRVGPADLDMDVGARRALVGDEPGQPPVVAARPTVVVGADVDPDFDLARPEQGASVSAFPLAPKMPSLCSILSSSLL